MRDLIVVKLGGSVITRKRENKLKVNKSNLERLCKEIAIAKEKLGCDFIIVHGAGPFGHKHALKYGLKEGYKDEESVKGMAVTHASMEKLNAEVVKALSKAGLNAIAVQPSASGIMEDRRLVFYPTEVIDGMLQLGLTPVGYGDVLLDIATGLNILSGDHLVPYLALSLEASRIVIATDVSGIYDGDPRKNKKAKLVKKITQKNFKKLQVSGSQGVDVTGGMERKVLELLAVAEHGIPSQVISGAKKNELKKALLGDKKIGTMIQ